jgi:tetratricopeptide (TPR) repeat protein
VIPILAERGSVSRSVSVSDCCGSQSRARMQRRVLKIGCSVGVAFVCAVHASAIAANKFFEAGREAYRAGNYAEAAQAFRDSAHAQPACGTLQNLGNAEWQRGLTGNAILAWEQALWVNPFDRNARNNLRFARETAQLEAPELAWYEVGSTWLPAHWWAWLAAGSLWLVVGTLTLPAILHWRKSPSQQAVAALGLAVFLLSIPAHVALLTRSRMGFVLEKDTPLRLTPTAEAEAVTRLAAGEPGRQVRARGKYLFIRTNRGAGWVERDQFGLVCSK